MDRREFINAVQLRLGPTFAAPAEDSMRAVFQVLHERLDPGQAGHIESHLPKGFKDDWQLGSATGMSRKSESLNRDEFLTEVQQKAGLGSMGDAAHATRAVFAALQEILPEKDIQDTAQELLEALRGLWYSVPKQRPGSPDRSRPVTNTTNAGWSLPRSRRPSRRKRQSSRTSAIAHRCRVTKTSCSVSFRRFEP